MNGKFSTPKWLRSAGVAALGVLVLTGVSGCKSDQTQAPIVNSSAGPDPADANFAPVNGNTQPTQVASMSQSYTPQQSSESYAAGQQPPAPIVRGNNSGQNEAYNYNTNGAYDSQQAYNQGYDNGVAQGETIAETDQAPPPLPEYDQPPAPEDNDIWTPGYWSYASTGYYWVPGTWVAAPYVGALWTPGYWGYYGNRYRWHRGYWGRHIGYYGGINYGWGYIGTGYYGGYWNSNRFYYNRAITHVGPRVVTVYERPVIINNVRYNSYPANRVSYNGGRGGIVAQPRPFEVAAMHEQHVGPLPAQQQFHREAMMNRANFYNENHGRPTQAAFAQPVGTRGFAGMPGTPPAPGSPEVNRGGFGRPGGVIQPGNNPPLMQQHNAQQAQRLQMEQQHNLQMQQHNAQLEQQRNFQMQQHNQLQQHNAELQRNQLEQQRNMQLQQHNAQFEQQRNLQLQQRNAQAEQQRNFQLQQRNQVNPQANLHLQQHNAEMQRNQMQQQHNLELQQHNAELEQQRNAQFEQQRNAQLEQQRANQAAQRNALVQQQHNQVQQSEPVFHPQLQHIEQPHVQMQPQPQRIEQPRVETPRVQAQPQPHFEQHSAPAPHIEAPRPAVAPGGGGGHPGGEHPGGGGHH